MKNEDCFNGLIPEGKGISETKDIFPKSIPFSLDDFIQKHLIDGLNKRISKAENTIPIDEFPMWKEYKK